jgi:hypothetical protein
MRQRPQMQSKIGRIAGLAVATVLFGAATAPSAHAEGVPHILRMFVTSEFGNGDFDTWASEDFGTHGFAAANSICKNLATAAGLDAPASFRAWLSNATTDAYCRVQGLGGTAPGCGGGTLPGAGPWARTDSDLAWSDALDAMADEQRIYLPPRYDESGDLIVTEPIVIWTGSYGNGVGHAAGGTFCNGWDGTTGSAYYGNVNYGGGTWSGYGSQTCTSTGRLLCIETGEDLAPSRAPAVPGGIIFLTADTGNGQLQTWLGGPETGVAAGDKICRTEAAAAKLPQATLFRALIYDGTPTPLARHPAIAWNRVDGYRVADSTANLGSGVVLAAPNETATGVYYPSSIAQSLPVAWTGLAPGGVASTNHCSTWASTAVLGSAGTPHHASFASMFGGSYGCVNGFLRLYCLSDREFLFWDNFERGTAERWNNVVGAP